MIYIKKLFCHKIILYKISFLCRDLTVESRGEIIFAERFRQKLLKFTNLISPSSTDYAKMIWLLHKLDLFRQSCEQLDRFM